MGSSGGLSSWERFLGRLAGAREEELVAADLGGYAHRSLKAWYDNPNDVAAIQAASAFYREALRNVRPGHAGERQRAGIEEQLAACRRDAWVATGFLGDLDEAIAVLSRSLDRTPFRELEKWAGRHWFLMHLHVLRHGASRKPEDARRVRELHRILESALNGVPSQLWMPDLRAGVLLVAAQLASVQGGEVTSARLAEEARRVCGPSFHPDRGATVATWAVITKRRVRLLNEEYQRTHDHMAAREGTALCSCGIDAFGIRGRLPNILVARRGEMLSLRYRLLGNREDARVARRYLEAALDGCDPDDAAWRAGIQWELAHLLLLTGSSEPLSPEDVYLAHRLAGAARAHTAPGTADHARCTQLLAHIRCRFPLETDAGYLRETVSLYTQSLPALRDAGQAWTVHNGLSVLHRDLYRTTGDLAALDSAIHHAGQAVEQCPEREAPTLLPLFHSNLGEMLRLRHEATSDPEVYARALEHAAKGVELDPHPKPGNQWVNRVATHAVIVALPGRSDDYRAAERLLRRALDVEEAHPEDRVLLRYNLGTIMRQHAETMQDRAQMRQAAGHLRMAGAAAEDIVARRLARRSLAAALHWLSESDGRKDLHREALEQIEAALAETPPGAPEYPLMLSDLGTYLLTGVGGDWDEPDEEHRQDLERAVEVLAEAVRLLPAQDIHRARVQTQHGDALNRLRRSAGDSATFATELGERRAALRALDESSPFWTELALRLVLTLADTRNPTQDHIDEVVDLCRRVARHPSASPSSRWEGAVQGAELLAAMELWDEAMVLWSEAVAILPQMAWGGLSVDDRLRVLGDTSQKVSDAAAVALNAGAPEKALELLEHGRSLLLAHALDMRADLRAVRLQSPALAAELEVLRLEQDAVHADSTGGEGALRRRHRDHWERLVDQVRRLPGLADFLKPPPCGELLTASDHGPVVVLNSSALRSDALVLHENTMTVVPLPGISYGKAVRRARILSLLVHDGAAGEGKPVGQGADDGAIDAAGIDLRSYLTDLLDWLWTAVAEPVLRELGGAEPKTAGWELPRLWWCPTGVFNHLPVHAATRFEPVSDSSDGAFVPRDSVFDRFVSSYIPTLRALRAARETEPPHTTPRTLLVGVGEQPPGTDLPTIASAAAEVRAIAGFFPDAPPLLDEEAVRETVVRRLRSSGWFHFAGHGEQQPDEPDGCLYLWGGSLRVRDITGMQLEEAEFAYLSACQTHLSPRGHSDEAVSLAGSLYLAGFRHVVAAQWQIGSNQARQYAKEFYRRLLPGTGNGSGASGAAYALHATVREFRSRKPQAVEMWAAYMHMGP